MRKLIHMKKEQQQLMPLFNGAFVETFSVNDKAELFMIKSPSTVEYRRFVERY